MTERTRSRVQITEMSFLRRVADELRVELLLLCIERSQLRWFGHLARMPPGRLPWEVFKVCPAGRRARGENNQELPIAAQMAAFVGKTTWSTLPNHWLEREPKLPARLAGPLHRIIMTTNLNPVKIVMLVKENPVLVNVEALEKRYQVMDLLCEQCVKQQDMNEVLAMKMHYISCVLQKCLYFLQKQDETLDALVKSLLTGRDNDGFPQYQEKLIRNCIRKFPFCEATLLQQLERSIAPVEIGNALSVLTQALMGQLAFVDADYCSTCGERGADKRVVSFVFKVIYGNLTCEKLHWFTHKKMCRPLQEQTFELEENTPRLRKTESTTQGDLGNSSVIEDMSCFVQEKYRQEPSVVFI
uniref:Ankyrin repeat and MYND domain containing 2 n=1 Tax=Echeneis naucrates TaxID=173247 RepID=A0A665VW04_ECHNA